VKAYGAEHDTPPRKEGGTPRAPRTDIFCYEQTSICLDSLPEGDGVAVVPGYRKAIGNKVSWEKNLRGRRVTQTTSGRKSSGSRFQQREADKGAMRERRNSLSRLTSVKITVTGKTFIGNRQLRQGGRGLHFKCALIFWGGGEFPDASQNSNRKREKKIRRTKRLRSSGLFGKTRAPRET